MEEIVHWLSSLSSKQWFSGLNFRHPMVSPIIPREATELPLPCVQLIAFIDLIGPPGHFSKTVIENAAWQVSRGGRAWEEAGRGGGWLLIHQRLQKVHWMPAPRMLAQGRPEDHGQKTGESLLALTGLKNSPRGRRVVGESHDKTRLLSMNPVKFKSNHATERPCVILFLPSLPETFFASC